MASLTPFVQLYVLRLVGIKPMILDFLAVNILKDIRTNIA